MYKYLIAIFFSFLMGCSGDTNEVKSTTLKVAFNQSEAIQQGWTLHLIGKDNKDEYSNDLKNFIQKNNLGEKVFLYGSCTDINSILKQANVGILVSTYEGFPVTLLEYGMANLGVVTTEVGYCSTLVENEITGLIVNPNSVNQISDKIDKIALDMYFRNDLSTKFNTFVSENYSANTIIDLILPFYANKIEK